MTDRPDPRVIHRLNNLARTCAVFSGAVGLLGFTGWQLHLTVPKTWGMASGMMKANSAACALLMGAALWLVVPTGNRLPFRRKAPARSLAGLVGMVALLSLAERFLEWNFGINQLLAIVPPGLLAEWHPGLMSPFTASCFLMSSVALLSLDWRPGRIWPAEFLCFGSALVAAFGILRLLLEPGENHPAAALPSMLNSLGLACGLLCSRPAWALGGLLASSKRGARLLRTSTPAAFLVLGFIGWSTTHALLLGEKYSWFEVGLPGIVSVAGFMGFIAWAALVVDRGDPKADELQPGSSFGRPRSEDRPIVSSPAASRLRREVTAGFAIAATLTCFVGFLAWRITQQAARDNQLVAHTHVVITALQTIVRNLLDVESAARGYALSGHSSFLESYGASKRDLPLNLASLGTLVADNPNQKRHLQLLTEQADARVTLTDQAIADRRSKGRSPSAGQMEKGRALMAAARANVRDMEDEETRLLEERTQLSRASRRLTGFATLSGLSLGLLFLLIAALTVREEIRRSERARARILSLNEDLERRVAQRTQLLTDSENRLAGVIESAMDAIITVDQKQHVVLFNEAAEHMFRCPRSQAMGQPVERFLPPRFRAMHAEHIRSFANSGVTTRAINGPEGLWGLRADGEVFQLEASISQIEAGGQKLFTAIVRDLTEKHRAEASRLRLAAIVESADSAVLSKDLCGTVTSWNRAAELLYGYRQDEIVGKHINLVIPVELQGEEKEFLHQVAEGKLVRRDETLRQRKDGALIPVSLIVSPVRDPSGKIIGASTIAQDITERKRTQKALEESEQRLRLALEAANSAIWEWDLRDNRNTWSEDLWKLYGIEPHSCEPCYAAWRSVLHPDNRDEVERIVNEAARTASELNFEFRVRHPDGSTHWLLSRARPVCDVLGRAERFVGIVQDITARKQAQEARLISEQRLRTLLDSTAEAILGDDLQGNCTFCNPAAVHLLGYSDQAELLGKNLHSLIHHTGPHGQELALEDCALHHAVQTGQSFHSAELGFWRKDRTCFPAECWLHPVFAGGIVRGAVLSFFDISERKQSEQRLASQAEELTRQAAELVRSREAMEAQARTLQSVLDHISDGVIGAEAGGKLLWNPAAEGILGRPYLIALGRALIQELDEGTPYTAAAQAAIRRCGIFLPDQITAFPADALPLGRAIRGQPAEAEMFVRRNDAESGLWLEAAASPLRDEDGKVRGGVVAFRNVTERKRTDEALRENRARLDAALASLTDAVFISDLEGRFLDFNDAFATFHRFNSKSECAKTFSEYPNFLQVLLPSGEPAPLEMWAVPRALRGETVTNAEYTLRRKDTGETWVGSYSFGPIRDKDSAIIGCVVAARDITQLKADEREIRRLNDELEHRVQQRTAQLQAANQELESFTYSVSHDLRAPLRHIAGFAKLLVEEFKPQLEPEAQHYLQRIEEGIGRMGQLVDELLNLARVGRHPLSLQVTGLNSIVQEVLGTLKYEMEGRAVEFTIGTLPFVECDPILIRQVFQNLLSNALKYTRPRAHAQIEVQHLQAKGMSAIMVRDNGVGFSMKYADKLFGVFQRLHRNEDFEGTGVGLATAQRIIQKHGGCIWAESELEKGAAFYFSLANTPAQSNETALEATVGART